MTDVSFAYDPFARVLIDWLIAQPQDHVINWSSDHVTVDRPYASGWVDVLVDEIQEHVPCNWLWTIDSEPDEEEATDPTTFCWPPDLLMARVWDPQWNDNLGPQRFELALDPDIGADPTDRQQLADAMAACSPDAALVGAPAWSQGAISEALRWWAGHFAGRPDLTFRWDPMAPNSPMFEAAKATLERIENGEEVPVPYEWLTGEQ